MAEALRGFVYTIALLVTAGTVIAIATGYSNRDPLPLCEQPNLPGCKNP